MSNILLNVNQQEGIVLILAPIGRDAQGATLLLEKAQLPSKICPSFDALCLSCGPHVGVILLAEEGIDQKKLPALAEGLKKQPLWSDLPIIILTRPDSSTRASTISTPNRLAEALGNVMFLERPLHGLTLVSAVRSALKARKRQYLNRDYLLEREQAAESLLKYQKKLEQSNKELEQFAAIASHDLQAPLRKVEMFADMLQKSAGTALPEECYQYLARMLNSVRWMKQLVSDLLNLSRVTRQAKPFSEIKVSDAIRSAVDNMQVYRQEVGGVIEVHIHSDRSLQGDSDQLQQVFQNLIENALKFSRKEISPVVKISVSSRGNFCEITVEDNGIGLNEAHSERIFETFLRLHGQNEYPGTGIGLSIVRKIIERHNGTVQVFSQPGQGCRFIVNLPISQKVETLSKEMTYLK